MNTETRRVLARVGRKGGRTAAANMTAEERRERAQNAAFARQAKRWETCVSEVVKGRLENEQARLMLRLACMHLKLTQMHILAIRLDVRSPFFTTKTDIDALKRRQDTLRTIIKRMRDAI